MAIELKGYIKKGIIAALRAIANPAVFVALVAPLIINWILQYLSWRIGAEGVPGTADPLLAFINDKKFLGSADYVIQIYSAVLAVVFWIYASMSLAVSTLKDAIKGKNAKEAAVIARPTEHYIYTCVSIVFVGFVFYQLFMGGIGQRSVLELYTAPRPLIIFELGLPVYESPLTWIRFGVAIMTIWLMRNPEPPGAEPANERIPPGAAGAAGPSSSPTGGPTEKK